MTGQFFARLEDGRGLRRTILEASKGAIHCLRAYQDIIRLRGEKTATLDQLRREMRELTVLMNRLDALMPKLGDAELAMIRPPQEPLPRLPEDKSFQKKGRRAVPPSVAPIDDDRPSEGIAERLARIERTLDDL